MTEKDKSEEKLKPSHGSKEIENHGGNSTVRNDASTQESPAGVQSVETEDPFLKGASRPQQHELLKQNVQADDGRQPQAEPAEEDTPPGLHATGTKVDKKTR